MARRHISDLEVVQAYHESHVKREQHGDFEWPEAILVRRTGQPLKVCYAAMDRACTRCLVDYGTSLRSGWLTDLGRELLQRGGNQ